MGDTFKDADDFAEYDEAGPEHPSPEQLLFRMAVSKTLNRDQRIIWELHNFDRLTTVEIAERLGVSQQNISKRIIVIEQKILKWCRDHQEVYKTLMEATNASEG